MIELINISYRYQNAGDEGLLALSNISLTLKKGDYISLIGSNGSGKSTLAMVMAGIYKPFAGSVRLEGMEIDDMSIKESSSGKIAVLFQNPLEHLVSGSVESGRTPVRTCASQDRRAAASSGVAASIMSCRRLRVAAC